MKKSGNADVWYVINNVLVWYNGIMCSVVAVWFIVSVVCLYDITFIVYIYHILPNGIFVVVCLGCGMCVMSRLLLSC